MRKYSSLDTDDKDSVESLLRGNTRTCHESERFQDFADSQRTPARSVVRYKGKHLNPEKPGHFNGKPTSELAADWKGIMQHQNVRLQRHELGPFSDDDNVIHLVDGSGYYATLAVFHGLHCLKRFHHYIHRDSYYSNMTDEDTARLLYHTGEQKHPLAVDKAKHQRVKWEPLEHWASEHSFDAFQQGLLVHPLFGKDSQRLAHLEVQNANRVIGDPYTGEKPDTIGIAVGDHPLDLGHEGHW
ncbi:uncharacterized protein BO97DRAFT_465902 [Aspergillus homomorphus CBS 101889]|uniref:Uncharacterized protein n=1 Tax=Aspergillus homomorphus (strain CBS 101889) TaxID=1450537 RepID=A0A395I3R5_ASPHC|nr:hypothetical protein BO97DRAFT_465902 [Aspergillus homomorphus CBS 101889]RAL14253.1 hypothetical protein BO97DRAFT_465902 [Aspergillus homomorphus CBS 101889]